MPWSRKKQQRTRLPSRIEFTGIEHPYGMHPDNPVLCGRGVEGELDYLQRVRCPSGMPIQFERTGAIARTEIDYLDHPDVELDVSRGTRRRLGDYDVRELPLDAYLFVCDCNEHQGELFIDMYFRGPQLPVGLDGWQLAGTSELPPIEIANCPYCDNELRTPLAKQCRFCKMDWHDPENVYRRE